MSRLRRATDDSGTDRRGAPLSCLVHVVDPELCGLLRLQELGSHHDAPFRLDFFNVFEGGAPADGEVREALGV